MLREGVLRVINIKRTCPSLNLHGFCINHIVVGRLAQTLDYFNCSQHARLVVVLWQTLDNLVQGEDKGSDGLTMMSKLLDRQLSANPLHHLCVTFHIIVHAFYYFFTINYLIKLYIVSFNHLCSVSRARAQR